MDVRLPSGEIIKNVPEGTSRQEIMQRAIAAGLATESDFGIEQSRPPSRDDYRRGMSETIVGPRQEPPKADTLGDDVLDVLGEFAGAANRSVAEVLDFFGPGQINNVLTLLGSDRRVPTAKDALKAIPDSMGMQSRDFMDEGTARNVVQGAGGAVPGAVGMVPVARPAATLGSAALDLLGVGATRAPAVAANTAATLTGNPALADAPGYLRGQLDNLRRPRTTLSQQASLARRSGDADTIGLRMDERGLVVRDATQKAATKQGVDDRVVTMLRDAPAKAREKMRAMLDVVEGSRNNAKFEALNRPGDVVGESITLRTRAIASANRLAGKQLDGVASNLKGKPVDVQPAIQGFMDDLDGMGIQFNPQTGSIKFEGSDIEGLSGPSNAIGRMINRLYNSGKAPDAYDVHRMKKWIDENVAWGKSGEGLSGRAIGVMKSLRHNLDSILDQQFPEYNRVNTTYSETIQALNALQDAAGKRIDITGKNAETALGTLSRRILGNVVSRQDLMRGLDEVDQVAQKVISGNYAGTNVVPYRPEHVQRMARVTPDDLDDDIVAQIRFVSELEGIFGTNAKNSFLGDISKATDRTTESLMVGDKTGPVREGVRMAIDRVRGVNEENALKALRELLRD